MANICYDEIKKAVGNALNDSQIEKLIDRIDTKVNAEKRLRGLDIDTKRLYNEAAKEAKQDFKNNNIHTIRSRINKNKKVISYLESVERDFNGEHHVALDRKLNRTYDLQNGLKQEWLGGILHDLEEENLFKALKRGDIDQRDLAKEIWELSKTDGKSGITGNKAAKKAAKIFHKWQTAMINRLNRSGANISKIEGYIVKQTHDYGKIKKAGFENWKNSILPKLDQRRTFKDMKADEIDTFLENVYKDILTGKIEELDLDSSFTVSPLEGDITSRISQERKLHFKSADDFMDYNNDFGSNRNLLENIKRQTETLANYAAILEEMGPSPKAFFNDAIRAAKRDYRGDEKLWAKVEGRKLTKLEKKLNIVDGSAFNVASRPLASFAQALRSINNMASLGQVTISAIADLAYASNRVNMHGGNFLKGYYKAISSLMKGKTTKQKKELGRRIGIGIDGILGDIYSRFSFTAGDTLNGKMAKMQETFFKFTGQTGWNDRLKRGFALMYANELGDNAGKRFYRLNKKLQKILKENDITPDKWEYIRKSMVQHDDGSKFIDPDSILKMDNEIFKNKFPDLEGEKLDNAIFEFKQQLKNDVIMYYNREVNHTILTPTLDEVATMSSKEMRGTWQGEAIKFFWQFKSFPLTVINKAIIPAFKSGNIPAMIHLMVSTTALGYVSMTLKDLAKGKKPRNLLTADASQRAKIFSSAFLQGGGAGIYGDFILGIKSRFGAGALETIAGPVAGDLAEAYRIFVEKPRTGKIEDLPSDTVRFLKNNMPFINLFYTRAAIDYLFMYGMQEAMSPGSLRRMERRIKKDNNQEFIFPPSEYANKF